MPTRARKVSADVLFEGQPGALKAILPVPSTRRRSIVVEVAWPDSSAPREIRVLTAPAGRDLTQVRLVLPLDTEPGTYDAVIRADDTEFRARLSVQGYRRLRVLPARLDLEAVPDGEAMRMVTLANEGNEPYDIGRAYVAGLSEEFGLDNAIGVGMTSDAHGVDRLGVVVEDFAARHAGLLRIAVQKGFGRLGPGEVKQLECAFRISKAQNSRVYTAIWRLHDVHVPVRLSVATGEPTKDPR